MTETIIPTVDEVLSTMEEELYKARCIVLTNTNNAPTVFRVDAIASFVCAVNTLSGSVKTWVRTGTQDDEYGVLESVPEILSRIARVEKDRL
jgi:hypothetical protein